MEDEMELRESVFRTGAGYPLLIAWSAFGLALLAVIFFSLGSYDRAEHAGFLIALATYVGMGPLSLLLWLIRRRLVFVQVDDDKGLLVRGREWIPWHQIRAVEAVPGLLGMSTQRSPVLLPSGRTYNPGAFGRSSEASGDGIRALPLFCLLLPLLTVFIHPKVIVTVKGRPRLVFRELDRDMEFTLRCVPRIRAQNSR